VKFLFCSGIFRAIYMGNPAIHTHKDSNYSGIPSIRFCGRQGHIGTHMLWFQWYSYDGTIAAIFGGGLCNTESAGITWDSEPCIVLQVTSSCYSRSVCYVSRRGCKSVQFSVFLIHVQVALNYIGKRGSTVGVTKEKRIKWVHSLGVFHIFMHLYYLQLHVGVPFEELLGGGACDVCVSWAIQLKCHSVWSGMWYHCLIETWMYQGPLVG
jgi:hypothetical protein